MIMDIEEECKTKFCMKVEFTFSFKDPKCNIVLTFASDYGRFYMYKYVYFFTDMLSLQQNISSVIKANRRLYGAGIFLFFFF